MLEPIPYRNKRVDVIVTLLDESDNTELTKNNKISKSQRPIGLAKDIFQVPESFFDELPDELLDAFEAKAE